ncbi:MAG: EAL domain-containing protein [Actinobacteria bacterium]|nr:EAL domain-containing protein [Actinomycetota bacterium]
MATFGVISLVPILLLGVFLTRTVRSALETGALASYGNSVQLMTGGMTNLVLTPEAFATGALTPESAALLAKVTQQLVGPKLERLEVRLVTREGKVFWATKPELNAGVVPPSPAFTDAINDKLDARFAVVGGTRIARFYIPIKFAGNPQVVGIAEASTSDTVATQAVNGRLRAIYLVLVIGLVGLWMSLFPIAMGVARVLRRQVEENEHLAMHDTLTGLPNRNLFKDRLDQALSRSTRSGHHTGLLFLDLDRFKEVNDALGHRQGDELIKLIAHRLVSAVRDADSVARLGGDEFAIIVPDVSNSSTLVVVAERFTELLREPFEINDITVNVEASIGVALYPDHGEDADTLMQHADIAMYAAKDGGLDYAFYSAENDSNSPVKLALAGELRRALDNDNELVMYYHPLVDLHTGDVTGVEALIRWNHPTRGFVYPDDFIPLAEQSGLIRPLTLKALDLSLAQCRRWHDQGLDLRVAVNLSARNLREPDLPDRVAALLRRHGVPASHLELEVTESGLLSDPDYANTLLCQLSALGIHLALDDFGTGYSSLSYLKNLPVNQLKIDRSFVNNMSEDATDAMIVRSVIDLAHNLGLNVTAEGVETLNQLDHLANLSCDTIQGYHLTKPLPADEIAAWVSGYNEQASQNTEGRSRSVRNPVSIPFQ